MNESNFKTKLSDFKPEELIGKKVLHEHGMTYHSQYSQAIRTISRVTKTGFKIANIKGEENEEIFSFDTGNKKGGNHRMDVGRHSQCFLLTDEEAKELMTKWAISRETKELKESLKVQIDTLDIEKLRAIKAIIETK